MEDVFRTISRQDDVLPMTTIEIIEYLKAMDKVRITDGYIQNHSDKSLWFEVNNVICEVKAEVKVVHFLFANSGDCGNI